MDKKINFCNCALPAITGNTECGKNCENNPNIEFTGYVDTTTKSDTIISNIDPNIDWISKITTLTKCPHCEKEFLFNGAVYCPYCGKELNPKPKKCSSYHTQENKHYFTDYEKGFRAGMGLSYKEYEIRKEGRCWGTKDCEPCSCDGDEMKCDFYPENRKRAKKGKKNDQT